MLDIHSLYRPFQDYFRPRRMRQFKDMLGVDDDKSILDIGGSTLNWDYIDATPSVTIVNLDVDDRRDGRFRFMPGDARHLALPDNAFDIVYSNSVIEHVGDFEDQRRFARETRRLAGRYYVQTPNRWFFIEPHLIAFFGHYFSKDVCRRLLPFCSIWYWATRPSRETVDAYLDAINLLTVEQMRELFPDAEIIRERFLGFTKSIIAVRR